MFAASSGKEPVVVRESMYRTPAHECAAACGRPFGRLFARVHRHTPTHARTRIRDTIVHRKPAPTYTLVRLAPRERELKGRDPNHFPKLLVDASIDVSPPVAGRAIESPVVQRGRLRSLKHTAGRSLYRHLSLWLGFNTRPDSFPAATI